MKKLLIIGSMGALLAGCYTERHYENDPIGGTAGEYGVVYGVDQSQTGVVLPPADFGPVEAGMQGLRGPGTASGGTLRGVR